jgi:hypothetical protein
MSSMLFNSLGSALLPILELLMLKLSLLLKLPFRARLAVRAASAILDPNSNEQPHRAQGLRRMSALV